MSTNSQVVPYTLIDYNGQKARKYPDGSIRDSRGRTLTRPPILDDHTITTTEKACALVRSREEKRARIIAEAANVAVERPEFIERYGSDAYIAEIGYAQAQKAMTPDDPKSTSAANFVFEQAGVSVKQTQDSGTQAAAVVSATFQGMQSLLRDLLDARNTDDNSSYLKHDGTVVLDGDVVDDVDDDEEE